MKFSVTNRHVDGGYGVVVVVSTFFIRLIVDGITFSYGNLLVEFLEEFGQDRTSTAVIGSLLHGTLALTAPVVAAMCEKFGYRVVVVLGAFISCIGFVISTFVSSVFYLYISYGLVGGLGFGMMYLPSNACVVQHFEKHRALATGISLCGSGFGTFVFNYLTRILIDNYGWRGTILLEAGFSLQCAIFGLLLLPPVQLKTPAELEFHDNPVCVSRNEMYANTASTIELECDPVVTSPIDERENSSSNNNTEHGSERTLEENISSSKATVIDNNEQPNQKGCTVCIISNPFRDNKLLKDPRFLVILLSTFIVFLAFPIPFNFTADLAVESGMTKDEASLLTSGTGFTNIIGRVLIGWLADLPCINQLVLTAVLLFLTGASTVISPLLTRFYTRMIYNCVFGFLIGGYYTLLSVVSVKLFGTEVIVKALGMLLFTAGIGLLIAAPIGGMFYDTTGNYDVTFVVAGSEFLVGGLLMLLIVICKQNRESTYL